MTCAHENAVIFLTIVVMSREFEWYVNFVIYVAVVYGAVEA
jgi:hypothetical protein